MSFSSIVRSTCHMHLLVPHDCEEKKSNVGVCGYNPARGHISCLLIYYVIASFYLELVLEDIRLARAIVVSFRLKDMSQWSLVDRLCVEVPMSCGCATTSLIAEVGTVTNSKFSSTRSR